MKSLIICLVIITTSKSINACNNYGPCIDVYNNENAKLFTYHAPVDITERLTITNGVITANIFNFIEEYIGIPYKWGGDNRDGIDCSAFVQQVFATQHIFLPRTSKAQFTSPQLKNIMISDLQEWDLLFFSSQRTNQVDHVAIYIGNGKMVHSSRNEGGVYISEFLNSGLWRRIFVQAKRLIIKPGE